MTPIGRNLTKLMKEHKLTLPKLATAAKVNKGNLSRIISSGKGYSAESLERLAKILKVESGVLLLEDPNVILPSGIIRVPIIDAIHAGAFVGVLPVLQDKEMREYALTSANFSERAFAMRVVGESMIPDFYPGDLVIIDPDASVNPGRFVVATNSEGEGTLKKYASRGTDAEGRVIFELIPSNPLYESLRSDAVELRIVGVARQRIATLP